MKKIIQKTTLFFFSTLMMSAVSFSDAERIESVGFHKSVVQVIVTYQNYDPAFPWRRTAPAVREGYAVVVEGGRLLTTERLIRNHALVEIRPARSAMKYPVRVLLADDQSNLALLDIPVKSGKDVFLTPVSVAAFDRDKALAIVQFDDTGQIQTGSGRISEVSVYDIPRSDASTPAAHVLTDLTLNGHSGTPVFLNGELFGITMQYDQSAKKCYVLPGAMIEKFINDAAISPYPGTASADFLWAPLIDPYKRSYLNLSGHDNGVIILSVSPGADDSLRAEDVIVEWDEIVVDSQGYYYDPCFGRLLFSHLIRRNKKPGDIVPVSIIRNGEEMKVDYKLQRVHSRDVVIPQNSTEEESEYIVEGGLIIMELTLDYLETRGSRWSLHTDPKLVHLYLRRHQIAKHPGDHVVIISRVLPDPVNIGYEQIFDAIISRINGEAINNLADVFRVADRDGAIVRITLESPEFEIVLDGNTLPEANERIALNYHIPKLRHQRASE